MANDTMFKTRAKDPTSAILGIAPDSSNIVLPISSGPHFLVAGTTGSGKSVFINSLLITMMAHSHPDELKLAIIDPKIVEFTAYKGLPYMLCDPVTDMSKANNFVLYLVEEMERRYDLMAENGVRNLADYQKKQRENDNMEKLPYIILVVDEFADLISQHKDVEKPIARIGQKARAAGIHMIIATQSPRREVITGLIKANVPSRVSLMVANSTESQIILDETGGEKLRPKGDFLLKMNGGQVSRGQAPFVSDDEIAEIFDYLRETYDAPEPIDFEAELQRMLDAKGNSDSENSASESASKFHGSGNTSRRMGSRKRPGTGRSISSEEKEKNARMREKIEENKKRKQKPPIKRTISGAKFKSKEEREKVRNEKGVSNKATSAPKITNSKHQELATNDTKDKKPIVSREMKISSRPKEQSTGTKATSKKVKDAPTQRQVATSERQTQRRPQRQSQSTQKPRRTNQLVNQPMQAKKQATQKQPSRRPSTTKTRPSSRTRPTSTRPQSRVKSR